MAKAKVELSILDKIYNSKNYTDLMFISIKDLIGSTDNLKPTDILLFPPYRAGANESKMKVLYNDIDYDSDDFARLKAIKDDLIVDTKSIKEDLYKVYYNQSIINEKPKYSVSEIKQHKNNDKKHFRYNKINIHDSGDTDDLSLLEDKIENIDRVDGSELGNMIHSYMEKYDFESEVEGLPDSYIDNIKTFLSSDLGKAVSAAKKTNRLYREQRFMIELPLCTVKQYMDYAEKNASDVGANACGARSIGADTINRNVIVQGVIDAFYINDNGNIVLIDYKTDGLSNNNISKEKLIDAYKIQLEIYAKALTQLTGKEVEKKYIYSFALNEAISI